MGRGSREVVPKFCLCGILGPRYSLCVRSSVTEFVGAETDSISRVQNVQKKMISSGIGESRSFDRVESGLPC